MGSVPGESVPIQASRRDREGLGTDIAGSVVTHDWPRQFHSPNSQAVWGVVEGVVLDDNRADGAVELYVDAAGAVGQRRDVDAARSRPRLACAR